MIYCNVCCAELEGQAVASVCGHAFCVEHAKELIKAESGCPQCNGELSKSTVKLINVSSPSSDDVALRSLSLAGLPPKAVARASWLAFNWCIEQARVAGAVEAQAATAGTAEELEQWKAKALELHAQLEKVTGSYGRIKQQRDEAIKDNKELQEKYQERCRRQKKLEQAHDAQQRELMMLRGIGGGQMQPFAGGPGRGMVGPGGGPGGPALMRTPGGLPAHMLGPGMLGAMQPGDQYTAVEHTHYMSIPAPRGPGGMPGMMPGGMMPGAAQRSQPMAAAQMSRPSFQPPFASGASAGNFGAAAPRPNGANQRTPGRSQGGYGPTFSMGTV